MSLINKVLQDLDERHAMAQPDGKLPPSEVRPVPRAAGSRDWFWRVLALLMLAALGWVGWVAYQMRPRPALATEAAFQAAGQAKQAAKQTAKRSPPPPAAVAAAPKVAPALSAAPKMEQAKKAEGPPKALAKAVPAPDLFKLALAIETPIKPRTAEARLPSTKSSTQASPKLQSAAAKSAAPRLEKHDEAGDAPSRAELEYRRAIALLDQGRLSEAEAALVSALDIDPGHEHARQSLVALLIDQRRVDEAQVLLEQGLARNAANARFAMVLARIRAERGQYAPALEALAGARPLRAEEAEFQGLRAALLQRLGRHEEAAQAYRAALRLAPDNGLSWVGLGISLDSLREGKQAGEAFRRAVATGTLSGEVKAYAESRARALP